jgi:hypothetical protein
MFWRILVSVAIAEGVLCVLPLLVAGALALLRLGLSTP